MWNIFVTKLNQVVSARIQIWWQMIDWKFFDWIIFQFVKIEKSANLIKFRQNLQFLTFVIFIAENSNKYFCKIQKILINFPSWQYFVFLAVFKIIGFEISNFKQWSCHILKLTVDPIALIAPFLKLILSNPLLRVFLLRSRWQAHLRSEPPSCMVPRLSSQRLWGRGAGDRK